MDSPCPARETKKQSVCSRPVLAFLLSIIVKSTAGSDKESLSPAFPETNSEIFHDWRADSRTTAVVAKAEAVQASTRQAKKGPHLQEKGIKMTIKKKITCTENSFVDKEEP